MLKLTIDHRDVEVPEGATVLDAARKLGIDIPALCFREGCTASTSCLACLVRVGDDQRLVPSCATRAAEGMRVESETEAVRQARRTSLELLLSDHLGDCMAPCHLGCPAQMDIPLMLRQIAAGQFCEAIVTVKRDIALPAVLGRICPAPCEKTCRRGDLDAAVSICLLKRLVADVDLSSSEPYRPTCEAASGKRVAIVGAGPTGLSAAYYLAQFGHTCDVFDENKRPGGRLLHETADVDLPRDVIAAEVAAIERLGVVLHANTHVAAEPGLAESANPLRCRVAGVRDSRQRGAPGWGLPVSQRGILVTPRTFETGTPGVFAAGGAVRGKTMVVRSVADGKEAAVAIDQFLCGSKPTGQAVPLNVKIGRMHGDEVQTVRGGSVVNPTAAARFRIGHRFQLCRRHRASRSLPALRLPRRDLLQTPQVRRTVRGEHAAFQGRAKGVPTRRAPRRSGLRAGQVHRLRAVHPNRRGRRRAARADVRRPRLRRPRGRAVGSFAGRSPIESGRRVRGRMSHRRAGVEDDIDHL